MVIWTLVLVNESHHLAREDDKHAVQSSNVAGFQVQGIVCAAYHFQVGLLQLASPLFQSLGKDSQLCVLPP